jgi:hypothetical protein
MPVNFLKRLSNKDPKTAKTLKIQQGSPKIWRFKFEKNLFLVTKWRIFQICKHHIFALLWGIFNVFTVLRSLHDNLLKKVTCMFLARV